MTSAASAHITGESQSLRYLWLYALAAAGGATAYMPFLTILLPVRVELMAGGQAEQVEWLAYCFLAGAIAASIANIAFGWLSDRTRTRTPWILAGLVSSCGLLLAMALADDLPILLVLLVAWQVSLNMMLSPLAALAGDTVPDHQKGLPGGLLALSPGLGAAAGAIVTIEGLATADERLALVAVMVAVCVLPVLLFGRPRPMPKLMRPRTAEELRDPARQGRYKRGVVARMWLARFLMQIAEAALFAYLYTWFRSISPDFGDDDTAQVFGGVLLVAVPLTLLVGRWSDKAGRPIFPLAIAAAVTAIALLLMASAQTLLPAIIAYTLFGLVTSMFLSLHIAQTLRVLPLPQRRGRDLGIFNLTNTLPALVMAGLSLDLVPRLGFPGFFTLLAGLAALAAMLLFTVPRTDQAA
ncbi:MFS transporter [Aurantiacibacter gangjinensis]|uniref:Membrane protein n=1 Tax=Aurantiacibacter gangjinensis TaxID=502682 RepID=A0A0G9MMB7_9SPHN|nr:MFS transporter [Aurantiacibacter gangjinensis]APE27866.1 hypothetical protein BMF35_a1037 [Aurantiacibacter gangjinensis]KLE31837.1 membrane protein [Aurantiacibacter gangjinensis]